MSEVMMPEPVAQQIRYFDSNALSRTYGEWSEWKMFTGKYERMGMNQKRGLITIDQAEAYAEAKVRVAQRWHPIDSAPHETLVVLGWYDENEVFKQEIALASAGRRYPGGASDMWWHGRATHWMPLPAPPQFSKENKE